MSEVKPYVMTWTGGNLPTDVDLETHISISGPFDTEAAAGDWGRDWQDDSGDDPRWQVVMLSEENMIDDEDGKILIVPILSAV